MSVEITAVHMSGGDKHEHIANVKWTNQQSSGTGTSTRAVMVDWIENKKGQAVVTDGKNTVNVGVVDATPKYLRTYADGIWTDNLLALPRY
jgi:catechol-2,3-dioxygenase